MGGREKSSDSMLPVRVERMKFYRYTDWSYEKDQIPGNIVTTIEEEHLWLVRETPCGWWVSPDRHFSEQREKELNIEPRYNPYKKRWISKTSRKKFCYPTRREALESFLARKGRQIGILKFQLQGAENAYRQAKRHQENKTYPEKARFPWT